MVLWMKNENFLQGFDGYHILSAFSDFGVAICSFHKGKHDKI